MKKIILIFGLLISIFCIESNAKLQEVQRSKETGMLMKWIIPPKIRIDNEILEGYDRDLLIYLETDENGRVQKAEVSKSSGVDELDSLVLRAVKRSKLKVWNE
ncbi:energy transducer TonB [Acinetobacter guillouiae]